MGQPARLHDISRSAQAHPGRRIGHPGFFEWVRVSDLRINRAYQRGVNQHRVADLAANWDDDSFGILLISRTDNGDYVLDGQHRIAALLAMGLEDHEAPAFVMTDLTVQQEADIFWRINKTRLQPGSADTYRARLVAGEEVATGMSEIIRERGVTVMYYPAALKPNEVYAIAAMERIYLGGDLDWVLGVIREGWPNQPSALRQDRLLGVWRFRQVFRGLLDDNYPEGQARRAHLIRQMHEFPPSVIVDKAIEFKTTLHSRPSNAFARALHFYFNYKIKTSPVKLPIWPSNQGGDRE